MDLFETKLFSLYVRSHSNSDYRHPARVGCDSYERAFKIMRIKNNKIYSKPRLNIPVLVSMLSGG